MTEGQRYIMGCLAWKYRRGTEEYITWGARVFPFTMPEKRSDGAQVVYASDKDAAKPYVSLREEPTLRICTLPYRHDGPHRFQLGYSEDNADQTIGRKWHR